MHLPSLLGVLVWVDLGDGAYEAGRSEEVKYEGHHPLDQFMEGVEGDGNLSDKFSGLGVGESSNTSIFQVMKALEDAEYTIRKQVRFEFLWRIVIFYFFRELLWDSAVRS